MSDARRDPGSAPAHGLVLVNARVFTGDPRRPWMDAVLVRDETVVAVGRSAELRKRAGAATMVIDARGLLALAGAPGALLRPGAPADLVLVERTEDAAASDDRIVFALERGRIVLDRLGLAGEQAP